MCGKLQALLVKKKGAKEFTTFDKAFGTRSATKFTRVVLKEGDEVITGSYKILRTLKPGSGVKIDNSVPKKEEEAS